MKEVKTNSGKWYVVTTANGCTVSFETDGGTVTLEMQAPQDVFCAVSGKAVVSDDAAVVTQTFNLAPSFFKAARGWGQDPIWFKSLHAVLTRMLDGTRFEMVLTAQGSKLIVHTDRVADDLLEQVRATAEAYLPAGVELVQYNHNMEISWRDINKYAACVTKADMRAVNPDYANDFTSEGEWVYLLDSFNGNDHHNGLFTNNSKIKKINIELPAMKNGESMFLGASNMTECILRCPVATALNDFTLSCNNLTFLEIYAPNAHDVTYGFGHRHNPSMKLSHFRFLAPTKISQAKMAWENTILSKESVLNIVENIPAWSSGTHLLDLGIHIDHQTDEEVLAAISNAEAKGWTLTVQWNGTPTAAASVMRFGRLIYAKVGEHELPDGTTERVLAWGHYVTDETGYETFRSLESAYEYFGLPMPAEESQPTE